MFVPAGNKQGLIGQTRTSLQNQDYPGNWSIVVVGDSSDDGTVDDIQNTRDTQTKHLSERPLPECWTGKLWSLQQGINAISRRGRSPTYFLFS
ncbi:MAG: hypothetical protein CBD27_04905 [Rhodospirillaceae bacterium TMED167]|nr:hypothetical protein [Rhodospirillaceae bacterium]OUW28194.1 MAG: hypothetical protein CBD27_04905 [Rhodospirillaceae bacterium TMED167]